MCDFSVAWVGKCKSESENKFCEKHEKVKCCVCGSQATGECCHTGQFVCGAPLCDSCEGYTKENVDSGSGVWGFANHAHRAKEAT